MTAEGAALTFAYDHNGLRTRKVFETDWYPVTTDYTLHGKLITHMNVHYTDANEIGRDDKLHFFYDAQSRPAKVKFNGVMYTYLHNLQDDVVGILDANGALVVEYKYDAWGKPIAKSTLTTVYDRLADLNPFRYRGYVYDEETGLYYLVSRYYSHSLCRFINADCYVSTTKNVSSQNIFSYCTNNPIRYIDKYGMVSYDAYDEDNDGTEAQINADIGGGGGFNTSPSNTGKVPLEAYSVRDYAISHNYSPMKGYKGGKNYLDKDSKLPSQFKPFYEYDIYPYQKGISRGAKRIVIGHSGISWYTADHYISFILME